MGGKKKRHPSKSEGAPRIDHLSVDRRFGSKNVAQEAFWSEIEKLMKNESKYDWFFNGKAFENYTPCNELKVFAISEKIEKIDAKMHPKNNEKVTKMEPQSG